MYIPVFGTIFLVTGVVIALTRFFRNQRAQANLRQLQSQVNNNSIDAEKLAEPLTCFAGKFTVSNPDIFLKELFALKGYSLNKRFAIHQVLHIAANRYLIVTECTEEVHDLSPSGFKPQKDILQINFVLKTFEEEKEVRFYSHYYKGAEEERRLKSFARELTQLLEEQSVVHQH